MSNNVQAKQVRKPMSPQTKRNLANLFGSLISNQRAIDGAKELPIWVAIIFFLLSIFLPVIPAMVTTSNTYGSSFVNTYSYNLDITLSELTYQLKQNGYVFEVKGSKDNMELLPNESTQAKLEAASYKTKPIARYTNSLTKEYTLSVYYSDATLEGSKSDVGSLAYLINSCANDTYTTGTTTQVMGATENYYIPSFVILHKNRLYAYIYSPSTATGIASSYEGCNWNNFDASTTNNLFDRVLGDADHNQIVQFNKKVFANWKTVFDEAYLQQKGITMVTSTFMYLGIYAGLLIFMGLMVFLLTRGKKNVFRYLSFLTCEKIAAWSAFTPALLGMILGFIFPSQSVIFFIMILGVRIMWLSMKQLRPQQY